MKKLIFLFAISLAGKTFAGETKAIISMADYPPKALREGREGTTKVDLTINVNGRVSACAVVQSSGSADLDEATCKTIQARARFVPATDDATGKPIEDHFVTSIAWKIAR